MRIIIQEFNKVGQEKSIRRRNKQIPSVVTTNTKLQVYQNNRKKKKNVELPDQDRILRRCISVAWFVVFRFCIHVSFYCHAWSEHRYIVFHGFPVLYLQVGSMLRDSLLMVVMDIK